MLYLGEHLERHSEIMEGKMTHMDDIVFKLDDNYVSIVEEFERRYFKPTDMPIKVRYAFQKVTAMYHKLG